MKLENLPNRFKLTGMLTNIYKAPEWTKDDKTGGGDYRLQIMSVDKLRNGETKTGLSEVSVGTSPEDEEKYKAQLGKLITLPVSLFVSRGSIVTSLAKE